MRKKPLVIITAVLLATAIIVTLFLRITSRSIQVSDYTDMTRSEVETWMNENDIPENKFIFNYEYNEAKPKDVVLRQSLKGGRKLGRN